MTKPICTADNPAPKGEPIYPGAAAAHTATPTWDHPEFEVEHGGTIVEFGPSAGFHDYSIKLCKHCGGNLP